jgi:hypothetical protein
MIAAKEMLEKEKRKRNLTNHSKEYGFYPMMFSPLLPFST